MSDEEGVTAVFGEERGVEFLGLVEFAAEEVQGFGGWWWGRGGGGDVEVLPGDVSFRRPRRCGRGSSRWLP